MKKFLTILSLATLLAFAGCRGSSDANTNANANKTNVNVATPTPAPSVAATDPAAKAAVEDALKKKNITGVTVDATKDEVTLRGSVAKGKMAEAVQAAQETGKRKVNNQLTEAAK